MLWDAPLIQCLVYTGMVCSGAALLGCVLGTLLALLTETFQVPLGRLLSVTVLSLILVPVYVQATAWSAGFGVQGWFRLSQVAAASSPVKAVAAVVWIHGAASVPVCFLLSSIGLRRALTANARQAIIDFGPNYVVTRVLLPNAWPWAVAGFLGTVAITGNDMVVTNLFQLPTLTESVYQQVQFGELRWTAITIACAFPGLLAVSVLGLIRYAKSTQSDESEPASLRMDAMRSNGVWKWLGTITACAIVFLVVCLPLANLVAKTGWRAQSIEGELMRSWSIANAMYSLSQVTSFASEFAWSTQLSFYASCLATIIGVGLVAIFENFEHKTPATKHIYAPLSWPSCLLMATMVFLLALPGPILNLAVLRFFNSSTDSWFVFLADRTLLGPILALQARCLPFVVAVLWIANNRFRNRHAIALLMDRGLTRSTQLWIRVKAIQGPLIVAWALSFFASFADLSSYLLVQPPGVTTVAMRMFDLLHYGVKNQESALALVLAVGSILATFILRRTTIK